jgi:phosphate starvation-inducible PhoH-like protein
LSPRSSDHSNSTDVESDRVVLDDNRVAMMLFGERNANLKRIEIETNAKLHSRGNELTLMGSADAIAQARRLVEQLYRMARSGRPIGPEDVGRAAEVLRGDASANLQEVFSDTILVGSRARPIAPKGLAQKRYVDAIRERDIVFAIGPAGTGKTYLAMALALRELLEKRVKRIVLTRPAIEAGERLGFLPGTMEDKVSPYLRPLYDALHDMVDFDRAQQLMERGILEIAPLAFMRGRTLNDSFVILDEAQNTTGEQMKMFLTRLGFESKAVVTGDVTQIDLPDRRRSGPDRGGILAQGRRRHFLLLLHRGRCGSPSAGGEDHPRLRTQERRERRRPGWLGTPWEVSWGRRGAPRWLLGKSRPTPSKPPRARYERDELLAISRALSSERDIRKLLDLILFKSRQITGADAGSVYVLEAAEAAAKRSGQRPCRAADRPVCRCPCHAKSRAALRGAWRRQERQHDLALHAVAKRLHGRRFPGVQAQGRWHVHRGTDRAGWPAHQYSRPWLAGARGGGGLDPQPHLRPADRLPGALHADRAHDLGHGRRHRGHSAHQQEARAGEETALDLVRLRQPRSCRSTAAPRRWRWRWLRRPGSRWKTPSCTTRFAACSKVSSMPR